MKLSLLCFLACFSMGLVMVGGCILSGLPSVIQNQAYAQELPAGSYAQSCQNCGMDGGVLSCDCFSRDGTLMPASMDAAACGSTIANMDGALTCEGPMVKHALPHGSYTASCRKCRVQGTTLICRCADRKGRYRRTEIPHDQCGNQGIQNRDGDLKCEY